MIKSYHTRPQNIKAVQWTGENLEEVKDLLGDAFLSADNGIVCFRSRADYLSSTGLAFFAVLNDYIYTENDKKFWKKSKRDFEEMYEED